MNRETSFGIFIGALLSLIGLLTYWLAPRVGPNPIFGVRVGYSFASRQVWNQTNRVGGALIAATGIGLLLLVLILRLLAINGVTAIVFETGAMIIALFTETIWLSLYARRLAQETSAALEIAPVKFRWIYLAPILITLAILIAVAIYFYPLLPTDRIATHFDLNGQPNDWMPLALSYSVFLGLGVLSLFINIFVVVIATREPLIAFERWGSRWRLDPERGLLYLGSALAFGNMILSIALFDIGWFNTRGSHPLPMTVILSFIFFLAAILVALFFVLGRREPRPTAN